MQFTFRYRVLVLSCLPLWAGCNASRPPDASDNNVSLATAQYLLTDEPPGAVGVIEAKESIQDGQYLVVVGRVDPSSWIEGRAAFVLVDPSTKLSEGTDDCGPGEICAADCCAEEREACTTLVKVVDAEGQVVSADARKMLGVEASDLVVVQGQADQDDQGNFAVLAKGVYVRR